MNSKFNNTQPTKLSGTRASILMFLFLVVVSIYLLIINIAGKIGMSQSGSMIMVLAIPVAVFLIAGFFSRISGPGGVSGLIQFQKTDGRFIDIQNALAASSEWLSLFMIIGVVSAFTTTNHDGIALISGVYCGLTFAALYLLPKFKISNFLSIAGSISAQTAGGDTSRKLLRIAITLVLVISAFLILISQIGAGAQILKLHFSVSFHWAAIYLIAPVLLAMLAGGMRGMTFANILLFALIAGAVILPSVWLSQRITGYPFPQLSFGNGALLPILELEGQLAESITGSTGNLFAQGNFAKLTGPADFVSTFFLMMAGTAALPLLFTRTICASGSASRTRTLGWSLLFIAIVLSFIPPFITFMKFEIYRDLVGLPVNQLKESANWLFNWASLEQGHHALVCGKSALNLEAIITACGGSDHVVLPSDLQFSPLMTFLGAGEIAEMPTVFSAIAYAGILSASVTTIAISLMVISNAVTSELILPTPLDQKHISPIPIAKGLFVLRLVLILVSVAGIWAALQVPVPVTDFVMWGFAISAGVLFPAMLISATWRSVTATGVLFGVICSAILVGYLLITMEYGPDWIAQNGDEPIWTFPFTEEVIKPTNSAIVGFLVAVFTAITISALENLVKHIRAKKA